MKVILQAEFALELPPAYLAIRNDVCCIRDYEGVVQYQLPEQMAAAELARQRGAVGFDQLPSDENGHEYFGFYST